MVIFLPCPYSSSFPHQLWHYPCPYSSSFPHQLGSYPCPYSSSIHQGTTPAPTHQVFPTSWGTTHASSHHVFPTTWGTTPAPTHQVFPTSWGTTPAPTHQVFPTSWGWRERKKRRPTLTLPWLAPGPCSTGWTPPQTCGGLPLTPAMFAPTKPRIQHEIHTTLRRSLFSQHFLWPRTAGCHNIFSLEGGRERESYKIILTEQRRAIAEWISICIYCIKQDHTWKDWKLNGGIHTHI